MQRLATTLALIPTLLGSAAMADAVWTGGGTDDNWTTSENWSDTPTGVVKILMDDAVVDVTTAINSWPGNLYLAAESTPTLNIQSGSLGVSSSFHVGTETFSPSFAMGDYATVNHTGGTLTVGNELTIRANELATYDFGSTASAGAPVATIRVLNIGNSGDSTGELVASGYGALTVTDDTALGTSGGANATLSIIGGNLDLSFGTSGGNNNPNNPGNLSFATNSTATATVNMTMVGDSDQISTINVGGDVNFGTGAANFNLLLDDSFSASLGEEFLLINAEGAITGTFDNVADGSTITVGDYQFLADYGTDGDDSYFKLTATVVPEPASLGLLGAGLVMMLARRRN